jgi:hypothetical protein
MIEVEARPGYAALSIARRRACGCAVEYPGIGRIDAAGSDANEDDLASAKPWTQHFRHAEVHTIAHKDRAHHVLLV